MKVTKDTMQPMPENHPTFRRGWSISGVPSLPLADTSPTKKDDERKATAPDPDENSKPQTEQRTSRLTWEEQKEMVIQSLIKQGWTREEAIHDFETLL